MSRRGYFQGGDWVPYQPGNLAYTTATSVQEIRKQKTIKCHNCGNVVPLKDICIFCDADLTSKDQINK